MHGECTEKTENRKAKENREQGEFSPFLSDKKRSYYYSNNEMI